MFLKQLPQSTPLHPQAPSMFLVMQHFLEQDRWSRSVQGWNPEGWMKYSLLKCAGYIGYHLRIWQCCFQSRQISQHVHWNHRVDEYECRIQTWLVHDFIQVACTSRQQNKSQTTICHTSPTWLTYRNAQITRTIHFWGSRHHDISKWPWSSFFSPALGIGWGEAGQHLHLARLSATPKRVVKRLSSLWLAQVHGVNSP